MTPPPVIDSAGRALPLGAKIGGGGEGDVYGLSRDPKSVVKLYHKPPSPEAVEKLTAMAGLGSPALLKVAAWPTGLARDARTRQAAGFVMPRVTDCQPVQALYNPAQRLRSFPRAGWAFQVRAALNLAAAFEEVHRAGCLVGDVNQSNALVSPKAEVRLIDCDSFQVRAGGRVYCCDVGVPHYTPPELQGKPLRGHTREENHDRFGLAVLIYQLLFVGRHPYAGVYSGTDDPGFEQLIADYRFAQGPDAHTWHMAPPPHVPTLSDIPPALGTLFRRAFERKTSDGRPTATEWHAELQSLDARVTTCVSDTGHTFWRGAGTCVWCRLAKTGPEYYFGVAGGGGTFAVDEAALLAALKRLEAARAEDFSYNRHDYLPPVPPAGRVLPAEFARLKSECQSAAELLASEMRERRVAEEIEKRLATDRERSILQKLRNRFDSLDGDLALGYEESREAVDRERGTRLVVASVLAAVTLLGIALVPLGLIHRGFLLFGGAVAVVFGSWLSAYVALYPFTAARHQVATLRDKRQRIHQRLESSVEQTKSETRDAIAAAEQVSLTIRQRGERAVAEAEQAYKSKAGEELAARSQAARDAEVALTAAERAWADRTRDYRAERSRLAAAITPLVDRCHELAPEYRREVVRVTALAEVAGRLRHLRLHPVADAVIPRLGVGRKEALAGHGILTAADISYEAVRHVYGFGDVLTASVIAWRDSVIGTYRFDPATAVAPSEQAALVLKFRGRQQQLLNELAGNLASLEALAPAVRADTEALRTPLRQAVARYEQARADFKVMTGQA